MGIGAAWAKSTHHKGKNKGEAAPSQRPPAWTCRWAQLPELSALPLSFLACLERRRLSCVSLLALLLAHFYSFTLSLSDYFGRGKTDGPLTSPVNAPNVLPGQRAACGTSPERCGEGGTDSKSQRLYCCQAKQHPPISSAKLGVPALPLPARAGTWALVLLLSLNQIGMSVLPGPRSSRAPRG